MQQQQQQQQQQHIGSSWTRDGTHVPCVGRWILIHQDRDISSTTISSTRDSFISSIMVWVSYINFSCHVALARTSGTVLNRNGKSRNSCSWSQGGRFILSPLSMMLTVGFLLMLAIKLREFSSVPIFLRVCIMNRCGILWKKLLHCMIWLCDFFFSPLTYRNNLASLKWTSLVTVCDPLYIFNEKFIC